MTWRCFATFKFPQRGRKYFTNWPGSFLYSFLYISMPLELPHLNIKKADVVWVYCQSGVSPAQWQLHRPAAGCDSNKLKSCEGVQSSARRLLKLAGMMVMMIYSIFSVIIRTRTAACNSRYIRCHCLLFFERLCCRYSSWLSSSVSPSLSVQIKNLVIAHSLARHLHNRHHRLMFTQTNWIRSDKRTRQMQAVNNGSSYYWW